MNKYTKFLKKVFFQDNRCYLDSWHSTFEQQFQDRFFSEKEAFLNFTQAPKTVDKVEDLNTIAVGGLIPLTSNTFGAGFTVLLLQKMRQSQKKEFICYLRGV